MGTNFTQAGRSNLDACISMIALTAVVVITRFASKFAFRQPLQGCDWLCVFPTVLFYIQSGLIMNCIIKYGDFSVSPPLEEAAILHILKITWISEFLFGAIITSIKLSLLWFYYSLFESSRTYQRVIKGTAVACILWFVITLFIVIFQCHPINAYWTYIQSSEYCMDVTKWVLGYELSNLFLDAAILCIPLGVVRRMRLSTSKKIAVSGIFLLGGLVCVASIVRLTAIWNPPNPAAHIKFSTMVLCATLQNGLGIICCCLPTLGHLYRSIARIGTNKIRNWPDTSRIRSTAVKGSLGGRRKTFNSNSISHSWERVEECSHEGSEEWGHRRRDEEDTVALQPMPSSTISGAIVTTSK
ncbi:hypothetical protein M426DRAFT_323242 [Hypoxylon sp. CI-4A]|nr:hypothetical protein M426DRAFT_323242 [Hypoxylon sp. CI-4A]